MGRFVDLTGQHLGKWVVLERAPTRGHNIMWSCRCECGTIRLVTSSSLTSKTSPSRSCYVCSRVLPAGKAGQHKYLSNYKNDARRMGRPWLLTDSQVLTLATSNCHYCGVPPSLYRRYPVTSGISEATSTNGAFLSNGIDRIDSARGYEEGNVVPCCKSCNVAKSNHSIGEFLAWVTRIYTHLHLIPTVDLAAS